MSAPETAEKTAPALEAPKVEVTKWQPPDPIGGYRKKAGLVYRLVDKNRKDRVDSMLGQGWVIVREAGQVNGQNESSMDGATHYRGMVLMAIAADLARQRNEFYRAKGNKLIEAAQAFQQLNNASEGINRKHGRGLTSTFGRVLMENKNGVLLDQTVDSNEVAERVDPASIRELTERVNTVLEENARLKRVLAERRKERVRGAKVEDHDPEEQKRLLE